MCFFLVKIEQIVLISEIYTPSEYLARLKLLEEKLQTAKLQERNFLSAISPRTELI